MIPVLMITYNRLEYTKKALPALIDSGAAVFLIDNNSTDGTQKWLVENYIDKIVLIFNEENKGIAGALNEFLEITKDEDFIGKVDNDTIVPVDWAVQLSERCKLYDIDVMQAKHPIIKATNPNGWEGFTRSMAREQQDPSILYHHFVGGSGVIMRRSVINTIPETEWKLYGWRQWQREHPELKKAFCEAVEVQLLDEHGYTDYPDYYKETKRL